MKIVGTEFDYSKTHVVYEKNGVKVTSFPVVHCISGAVGYRLDFAGVSFGFSGDARPCWPLVRACEGVDVLIHECFPPAAALAAASGLSIERQRSRSMPRIPRRKAPARCSTSSSRVWRDFDTRCFHRR
jgi:hypothetical protein